MGRFPVRQYTKASLLGLALLTPTTLSAPPLEQSIGTPTALYLEDADSIPSTGAIPATAPGYQHLTDLGTLELLSHLPTGENISELSGLAWAPEQQILLAITDSAKLIHFKPVFEDDRLTDLLFLKPFPLSDKHGDPLTGVHADSEALHLLTPAASGRQKPSVLITFEGHPRRLEFSLEGQFLAEHPIPEALRAADRYQSTNKGLEAFTIHPTLGPLFAPEWPLKGDDTQLHQIYDLKGHVYRFPRLNPEASAITAMEALPNGRLIVLERTFVDVFTPIQIALYELTLNPNSPTPEQIRTLAVLDNAKGWHADNFEGLTHLGDQRFLMVSDNNENPFQRSLIHCFQLKSDRVQSEQSTLGRR